MAELWGGFVFALEEVLRYLFEFTHSAGLAIILFTIAVKVILLPLTISQLKSSREMQKLQPKLRELQKKHGKDREKLNQEMAKLYREHGVSPVAGCLPSLLQLPIFFGVYYAVLNLSRPLSLSTMLGRWLGFLGLGISSPDLLTGFPSAGILADRPFLWMPSMGMPDPWRILPILAAVLQLAQQRMMTPRDSDPQQSAMNNAMMFMPLLILFLGWTWPAGPVLYWVTQSVVGIVQQYYTSGWGSLRKWLPFLPERKQPQRELKPKKEQPSPEAGKAEQPRGWFWKMMDRMSALQEEAAKRDGLTEAEGKTETEVEETPVLPPTPEKRRSRR